MSSIVGWKWGCGGGVAEVVDFDGIVREAAGSFHAVFWSISVRFFVAVSWK